MKRLLVALLLILAASSLAVPQRRMRGRAGRPAAEGQARSMAGVTIRGNTIRFSRAWRLAKGTGDKWYARKIGTDLVLAVNCLCAQEGPSGSCFTQSMPGRNDTLRCNKTFNCTGACGPKTNWVEPGDIPTIGIP